MREIPGERAGMTRASQIAVVGAGMVGASAALGLARMGHQITLFEPGEPSLQTGSLGVDVRNVALTPASRSYLEGLGVWPTQRLAAYHEMYVWEEWGSGHIHFCAADAGEAQLGWIVEASPLTVALWAQCQTHPNITICASGVAGVNMIESPTERAGLELTVTSGEAKAFDFCIGADGARSTLRGLLGVDAAQFPTHQVALATAIRHSEPHNNVARQRFLVDGPLALLPSQDPHVCSVVWSQSPEAGAKRRDMAAEAFCADIENASEGILGRVEAVDQRVVFPLTQQRAATMYPHPGVLLIGDAMRVVHPLAGLGVNLGFEDVVQMLDVAQGQDDLARPELWRGYARRRESRARAMMATMTGFKTLFGLDLPGAGLLRKLGMASVSAIPGLKAQIMREAMGLGSLAR